jgi:hypothetical protein
MRRIHATRIRREQTAHVEQTEQAAVEADEQTTEVLADTDDVLSDIDECLPPEGTR